MERVKALVREPALLIDAFESLVVVLVAAGLFSLTGDQQTNTIALFIAVLALAKGVFTRPFPVTVIPDLGRAAAVFCVSLGILKWSPDQVTIVVTFLGTLMTVVQRVQITPTYDPVARPGGAGAGPVAGKRDAAGVIALGSVAWVLVVLGIILVLVDLLTVAAATMWVGIVLILLGVVLLVVGGSNRPIR